MSRGTTPRYSQPVDLLVATVSPGRAFGFVQTCVEAAGFVETTEPDLVLFPNRGASPMLHAIRGAGLLEEVTCIEPLIGSAVGLSGSKGIDGAAKKRILEEDVLPGMRVALIDESQHGGTIKQHRAIATKITRNDVVTCQIQDDRVAPRYNVGDSDTTRLFTGPLFHVDRNPFLDEIVVEGGVRHLQKNDAASQMFQALGNVVADPICVEYLVGDQIPRLPPEQIAEWVNDFNAHGLSI